MKSAILLMWLIISCGVVFGQEERSADTSESHDSVSAPEPAPVDKRGLRIAKKNVIKNMWFAPSKRDYEAIAIEREDVEKYADFLVAPDRGLIRLHDSSKCEASKNVVNLEEPCPSNFIYGKGASYSFRTHKYRSVIFSDLEFYEKKLYAVGLNTQGILTTLGGVALDAVSLETNGVKQLHAFAPARDYSAVNNQITAFLKGVRAGRFVYQKSLPINKNETYVLRSIAYGGKVVQRQGPFKVNLFADDKRDDVIIVFRVVREHADGSITLLWKEINRQPAPKLNFEKAKKQSSNQNLKN